MDEDCSCGYCRTGVIPQEWIDNAKAMNEHFPPITMTQNEKLKVTWSMGFTEDLDLVSVDRKVERVPIES